MQPSGRWARLDRVVGDLQAGSRRAVQVVAPGGWGADEAGACCAAALVEQGRELVRVTGRRLERDVAGGALADALSVDAATVAAQGRRALGERLGDSGVLLVSDAHWLDDDTVTVLAGLAARLDGPGPAIIVTGRPWPTTPALATLDLALAEAGAVVPWPALAAPEVADRLVGEHGGRTPSAGVVGTVLARTAGVVWLVDHLAAALAGGEGEARAVAAAVPDSLVAAVRSRLGVLGAAARELVVAVAVGADAGDVDVLARMLGLEPATVAVAAHAAEAEGLLLPGGAMPAVLVEAVAAAMPEAELRARAGALAHALDAEGAPAVAVAAALERAGSRAAAADRYLAAGDDVAAGDPGAAVHWYRLAAGAGAGSRAAARLAVAAARAGDDRGALEQATAVLADAKALEADRGLAAAAAAAVYLARGLPERADEVLGGAPPATPDRDVLAALVAIARGDAHAALGGDAAPSASRLAARAVLASIAASADDTVDLAAQAVDLAAMVPPTTPEVDRAPVVAALLASAALDLGRAARFARLPVADPTPSGAAPARNARVGDATGPGHDGAKPSGGADARGARVGHAAGVEVDGWSDDGDGGAGPDGGDGEAVDLSDPVARRRALVAAWVDLRAGRVAAAQAVTRALQPLLDALAPRDQVLVVAIDAGAARRSGDVAALTEAWVRAKPVLLGARPDLLALPALGELTAVATRMGALEAARPVVARVDALLDALGHPPLWSALLAWETVQSSSAAGDVAAAAAAAEALAALAPATPTHAVLQRAGAVWVDVLGGRVDAGDVERTAEELRALGLTWEATHLTGQAAIRSTDSSVTRALLGRARDLKGAVGVDPERLSSDTSLSDRELEVARLVSEGLTHKEVGERLFISAKTVEHHVARIRQKLGATTRAEMMAAIAQILRR